jgi:hypothetical protein
VRAVGPLLLVVAALVLPSSACNLDGEVPNARLVCTTSADCPAGFSCVDTARGKLCCRGGDCGNAGPPAGLQIVDDGLLEVDLATQCSGDSCITGGITP